MQVIAYTYKIKQKQAQDVIFTLLPANGDTLSVRTILLFKVIDIVLN